jgi:hypothetical protein
LSDPAVSCTASATITCNVNKTLAAGESITLPDFYPQQFPGGEVSNVARVSGGGAANADSESAVTSAKTVSPVAKDQTQVTSGRH